MGWPFWAALGLLGLAVAVAVWLSTRLHDARRLAREDHDALVARQEQLESRLAELAAEQERRREEHADYVITRVGEPDDAPGGRAVADQLVLSATFGEPLVKVVALGHGVRRALAAESRHRIRFAMRQEVRRTRKQRRREMRQAWRQMKSQGGQQEDVA